MRHFVRLSQRNYAIDLGLFPLGSCTMKHNPRLNERAARFEGFADLHPLQPTSTIQGALDEDPALRGRVKLVTISFDPAHDTPAILAAHAKRRRADPAVWTFLTGDRVTVDRFAARLPRTLRSRISWAASAPPDLPGGGRVAALDQPDGVDRDVAGIRQPMRRRGVERDRVSWLERVRPEADRDVERAAQDVAPFMPAVALEGVLRR